MMNSLSIEEFIRKTVEKDHGGGLFELENPRILEINLDGMVWVKAGSMIAYEGSIKYEREGIFESGGIGGMFKKAFTGEGASLMKAMGNGKLYLADEGKRIIILRLENEAITVNGNDVLAFEPTIKHDIRLMKRVAGMLAGGLFNVHCQGSGLIAITTHHEALTLRVTPGQPVFTDPNATVAWSGHLQPEIQTDITLKTLFGRGSGESFQMRFEGDGFVIVQPYEEVYFAENR